MLKISGIYLASILLLSVSSTVQSHFALATSNLTPLLAFNLSTKKASRCKRVLVQENDTSSYTRIFRKPPSLESQLHQSIGEDQIALGEATGIYVHIPYCRRRCRYCDFAIVPIGDQYKSERALTGFQRMDESYRKSIISEIDLLIQSLKAQTSGSDIGHKIRLSSIYFGGGTPSLAPIQTIQSIVDHILASDGAFLLEEDAEMTIEMDPGTFTVEHLQALKQIGFNRISLGVQSFNDTILEGIGRVHRRKDIDQAIQSIDIVYGSDGANYSLDLISGLPGLTLDLWNATIQTALSLKPAPNHLSVYDLQIEEGTNFGKLYTEREDDEEDMEDDGTHEFRTVSDMTSTSSHVGITGGLLPLPSSEECASMYKHASEYLRSNGFEHYEISSYARVKKYTAKENTSDCESFRSRHNQIYWRVDSEWYAVGLSATSFIEKKRFARPRMLSDYNDWVSRQATLHNEGVLEQEYDWLPFNENGYDDDDVGTKEEILLDTIMTRLRTREGLDLNWIAAQNDGTNLLKCVLRGAELQPGLVHIDKRNGVGDQGILRLIDPEGFLFSNYVISNIFAELP